MVLTLFTAVISIIAIIIYMVDIVKHPQTTCQSNTMPKCGVEYQLTVWQKLLCHSETLQFINYVMFATTWRHGIFTFYATNYTED